MIVSWLSIHLACQTKSVIWTILFLGLPHHLWFVTVIFPVPQQQECEEHEDTHWLCVSPGVLEHRSPSQGVLPFALLPSFWMNLRVLVTNILTQWEHQQEVGLWSTRGAHEEHTRSTQGAHLSHCLHTAQDWMTWWFRRRVRGRQPRMNLLLRQMYQVHMNNTIFTANQLYIFFFKCHLKLILCFLKMFMNLHKHLWYMWISVWMTKKERETSREAYNGKYCDFLTDGSWLVPCKLVWDNLCDLQCNILPLYHFKCLSCVQILQEW